MSTTITASQTILMHASLACISPEVQALDSVILSRDACLPTELLSLIRSHLLPFVTSYLLQKSTHALAQYESSLRGLLCFDCVVYNHDIYGPDVWQWEQFSGACACARVSGASIFDRTRAPKAYESAPFKSVPRLFRDRIQWLESHLSTESQRILGPHVSLDNPSKAIWRVVEEVLNDQDCRILGEISDSSNYGGFLGARTSPHRSNLVTIVSTASGLNRCEGSPKGSSDGEYWDSVAVLHRAKQNLGLDIEYGYEEGLENPTILHSRPRPRLLSELNFDSPTLYGYVFYARSVVVDTNPLQALATLIAVCLSLPLTFAALAFTILCFYSRPQSFRIL